MRNVGIAGSRGYNNYISFAGVLDTLLQPEDILVSGGCPSGADFLAEKYAKERSRTIEVHKADWNKYGRAAGMIRNNEIVNRSDFVIAFWDLKSPGTKDTIEKARQRGVPVHVEPIC